MLDLSPLYAYFAGEKGAAWSALGLGVLSLTAAGLLWRSDIAHRAMWWPLAIAGLIQLAIPVVLLTRTDPQVAALDKAVADVGPIAALGAEQKRMDAVNRQFTVLKIAWVALIVLGLGLVFASGRPSPQAVGAGLLIEAALVLAFDMVAAERAEVYARWLGSQLGTG